MTSSWSHCSMENTEPKKATMLILLPYIIAALFNSFLLRAESVRIAALWLNIALWHCNLMIHSAIILFLLALHVINAAFSPCITAQYMTFTSLNHALILGHHYVWSVSYCSWLPASFASLLAAASLLESSIYCLFYPNIIFHAWLHTAVHMSLSAMVSSHCHSWCSVLILLLYATSHYCTVRHSAVILIYSVSMLLWSVSISFMLHLQASIILDLFFNISLWLFQFMLYLHLVCVCGHVEV